MIRLLYLAPLIAVFGFIIAIYMVFFRPVTTNNRGESLSASASVDGLKSDFEKLKQQQDLLAGTLEAHKQGLILESANATKLYDQANRNEFEDMDLIALKQSITDFNRQALELAGNETAIIAFNDQLREGIASLDRQIRAIDITDLLKPKDDVNNRLNSLKVQVAKLAELQREIIAKSKEYNERSRETVAQMKQKLTEQGIKLKEMKSDRTALLEQKIQDSIATKDDMLQHIVEQSLGLEELRKQNLEQLENSRERVKEMMEKMRDRMEDVRDKMADNRDKMRDARDKAQDAKDRAEDARDRAEDAKQRAKDMQQTLRDRMNR